MEGLLYKLDSVFTYIGVVHLVRTHEGGRGVKQMHTNAYKGGGGVDT